MFVCLLECVRKCDFDAKKSRLVIKTATKIWEDIWKKVMFGLKRLAELECASPLKSVNLFC